MMFTATKAMDLVNKFCRYTNSYYIETMRSALSSIAGSVDDGIVQNIVFHIVHRANRWVLSPLGSVNPLFDLSRSMGNEI